MSNFQMVCDLVHHEIYQHQNSKFTNIVILVKSTKCRKHSSKFKIIYTIMADFIVWFGSDDEHEAFKESPSIDEPDEDTIFATPDISNVEEKKSKFNIKTIKIASKKGFLIKFRAKST